MTKQEFRNLHIGQKLFTVNLSTKQVDELTVTETPPVMGAGCLSMVSAKDKEGFSRLYEREEVSLSLKGAWTEFCDNAKDTILDLECQIKQATNSIEELKSILKIAQAEREKASEE